jgi:hypothetical protein
MWLKWQITCPSKLETLSSNHSTVFNIATFFLGGTGVWTLDFTLLGRCSTIWAFLPALFVLGMFEIGSHELFALAGFKLSSSRSLPPKELEFQGWATIFGPQIVLFILLMISSYLYEFYNIWNSELIKLSLLLSREQILRRCSKAMF